MELLGDKNWWIPKWLDRIPPNQAVEPDRTDSTERPSEIAQQAAKRKSWVRSRQAFLRSTDSEPDMV